LRQCTLYGLRTPAVRHFSESLMAALNLLRSVLGSQALQAGSSKATEFTYMCRHFAQILVPLVKLHLETVFGTNAQLDMTTIIASMAPDLLPASVAEDPFAADASVAEDPFAADAVVEGEEPAIDESLADDVPDDAAGVAAGMSDPETTVEPLRPNGLPGKPSQEAEAAVKEATSENAQEALDASA